MSEWGNPVELILNYPWLNKIGQGREPGELKHLSSPRKRDHSVSSGERTRKSPNRYTMYSGVVGAGIKSELVSGIVLER